METFDKIKNTFEALLNEAFPDKKVTPATSSPAKSIRLKLSALHIAKLDAGESLVFKAGDQEIVIAPGYEYSKSS
ncbi:MAG: hypothetical protein ACRYGG_12225 [Janthinobacterium lividum]